MLSLQGTPGGRAKVARAMRSMPDSMASIRALSIWPRRRAVHRADEEAVGVHAVLEDDLEHFGDGFLPSLGALAPGRVGFRAVHGHGVGFGEAEDGFVAVVFELEGAVDDFVVGVVVE